MTDRIHSLTVILERDIREDDVQPIIDAIGMVRGVLKATPRVADHVSMMAEMRAKQHLTQRIWAALNEETSGETKP